MNSIKIALSNQQIAILTKISRQKTSNVREVERSKILLMLWEGKSSRQISMTMNMTWEKVQRCRRRWLLFEAAFAQITLKGGKELKHNLEAKIRECLKDASGEGCPSKFTAIQYYQILAVSVENPTLSGRPISNWTHIELADEVQKRGIVTSISRSQIGNFLKSVRYKTT
jgi:hypothetical protein